MSTLKALRTARCAQQCGLTLWVGCMVGTSLVMPPAMLIGAFARFVDLDGTMLLARGRANGLYYSGGRVQLPKPALWG